MIPTEQHGQDHQLGCDVGQMKSLIGSAGEIGQHSKGIRGAFLSHLHRHLGLVAIDCGPGSLRQL